MKNREMILSLRSYGFPLWAIVGCLKLHNNDFDMVMSDLRNVYNVVGDNPDIVIQRNEEDLRRRITDETDN